MEKNHLQIDSICDVVEASGQPSICNPLHAPKLSFKPPASNEVLIASKILVSFLIEPTAKVFKGAMISGISITNNNTFKKYHAMMQVLEALMNNNETKTFKKYNQDKRNQEMDSIELTLLEMLRKKYLI